MVETEGMETWFRRVLGATGVVNLLGASTFLPANRAGRDLLGLPNDVAPLYLAVLACWIFGFGIGYLWLAVRPRREWLFLAIGAFGKLAFVALLIGGALTGSLPPRAVGAGAWDLVIGALFVAWLVRNREAAGGQGRGDAASR